MIVGRCNVGKSTLINALCEQSVALVSAQAGTTNDLDSKPMEMLPYGPVVFVDTGGLDDNTTLGRERVKLTERALRKADLVLLVVETHALEREMLARLAKRGTPSIVVINWHSEPSGKAQDGLVAPCSVASPALAKTIRHSFFACRPHLQQLVGLVFGYYKTFAEFAGIFV